MRFLYVPLLTVAAIAAAAGTAFLEEKTPRRVAPPRTFAIETYVARTYNYLDNMVDRDGLPYLNVFWTEPADPQPTPIQMDDGSLDFWWLR